MTTTQSISLFGEREKGETVRTQNMTAAVAIANIVKSSLGPVGLDKMLVDEVGCNNCVYPDFLIITMLMK